MEQKTSLERSAILQRIEEQLSTGTPESLAANTARYRDAAALNEADFKGFMDQLLAGVPKSTDILSSDDPEQMLTVPNLGVRFGLSAKQRERLRKRLDAWRNPDKCGDEWCELLDRRPRQPKYLYRLGSIEPIIRSIISRK